MKRNLRRPLLVIGCGVIFAALVLVVTLNLDRGEFAGDAGPPRETIEIIEPDLLAEGGAGDPAGGGGGIQITDEQGQLAQQYRYAHLDPDPEGMGPGWFGMTEPELEVYLPDGVVVLLTGDFALAYRPNRAIESGTLTGNVLIRLFEDIASDIVDPSVDEPSLALRTAEARFDNIVGEVVCDGDLFLETRAAEFRGRQLLLRINDRDDIIQLLRVAEVDYVRLAKREGETPTERITRRGSEQAQTATPTSASGRSATRRQSPGDGPGRPRSSRRAVPGMAGDEAQFYRLTLHENVRIRQGESDDARTATGDALSVIFTTKSEGLGGMLAARRAPAHRLLDDRRLPVTATMPGPRRIEEILYAAVLASYQPNTLTIAPAPSAEDTYVTCDGPLIMEPLAEPDPRLASPADSLMELTGDPVRLVDPVESAEATCARLEYHARNGRLELIGSDRHELCVKSPQLEATGRRFWIAEADAEGGFTGAGSMKFLRPPDPEAPAGPSPYAMPEERLSLAWNDRVDLTFGQSAGAGTLGALNRADFHGAVRAHSSDLSLSRAAGADDRALGEPTAGDLKSDRLTMEFEPDENARIRPARMIAAGAVEISDTRQTLWTRSLDVKFASTAATGGEAGDGAAAEIEVAEISAEGGVQMLAPDGQRVFAERMEFDGRTRCGVLTGPDIRLVDGNNLIDRATRITIDDAARTYTLHGGGRFWRFDGPLLPEAEGPLSPNLLDQVYDRSEDLRITWTDRVDVRPAEERGEGADDRGAQVAVFRGDVQVVSPRLKLTHADEMHVALAEDEAGHSTIESIDAIGDVHSRAFSRNEETGAVREVGDIACRNLHVDITRNEQGQTVPARMEAAGAVRVAEENQTLWTETLTVTFGEKRLVAPEEPPTAAREGDLIAGEVQVDTITAEGGVRLLLKGGERVFGDRLAADVAGDSAELFGDRVLIVTDEFILDRGRHLVLDRHSGAYEVRGPGEFHAFAEPIRLDPADPLGPPVAIPVVDDDTPRSLRAYWTGSALYTEEADGKGALDLRDDVYVFARTASEPGQPVEIQKNTVDAEALTLQFEQVHPAEGGEPTRELTSFEARGDAKLENRTWRTADESDEPRVFYIAAQHIDYDLRTLEALVVGDGELVIRDAWIDETEDDRAASAAFSAKGVTLFRWRKALRMTQEIADRFNISMTGNVECLHTDPDGGASSLTGQEIQATVERGTADPVAPEAREGGALDFGGAMELKRLYGRGGVFVRTPDHDVACEVFRYNPMTGLAEIAAARGGFISVMIPGSPYATRAERAMWDMNRGIISVTRGAGAGAP